MHGFGVYWELLQQEGVPLHSLSPHKLVPVYLSNLISLLHRGRFDLAHCHLIAANLIAKPLAYLCGVPVLFNHDQCNDVFRYRNKGRLWLDRLTNRFTDQIIAVSQSTRNFLLDWEKIPPQKVALIYNAVDLERFFPGSQEQRLECRRQFGFVGNCQSGSGSRQIAGPEKFPRFSGGSRFSGPVAARSPVCHCRRRTGPHQPGSFGPAIGHCRPGAVSWVL